MERKDIATIGISALAGYIAGSRGAQASVPKVPGQIYASESYIISTDNNKLYAMNGTTGNVDTDTDFTALINNVSDAIINNQNQGNQGTIFIKSGNYDVSAEIPIKNGISVIAEKGKSYVRGGITTKAKAVTLKAVNPINSIFKVQGKSNIENIEFDANNLANLCIDADRPSITVDRSTFINSDFRYATNAGVSADNHDGITFIRCGFVGGNNVGFLVPNQIGGLVLMDKCVFGDNKTNDIYATSVHTINLHHCTFANGLNLTGAQIHLRGINNTLNMTDCWMENPKYENIKGEYIAGVGRPSLSISNTPLSSPSNLASNITGNWNKIILSGKTYLRTYGTPAYSINVDYCNYLMFLGAGSEDKPINFTNIAKHKILDYNGHYHNKGATLVADGGTINHDLITAPNNVNITPTVAGEFASVTAKTSTNFTVSIKKLDGTPGTTQTIYWDAEV